MKIVKTLPSGVLIETKAGYTYPGAGISVEERKLGVPPTTGSGAEDRCIAFYNMSRHVAVYR